MSDLETVLERLVLDAEFQRLLAADPSQALASYNLSDEDREVLAVQLSADVGGGYGRVEERLSKASLVGLLSSMVPPAGAKPQDVTGTGRGQGSTVDTGRPSAQLPAENGPRFALSGWGYPESYAGALKGTGDSDILPGGTYFQAGAGVHKAGLVGPAGTDFDLKLYKWHGEPVGWVVVASASSSDSTEQVTYNGNAGYFMWVAHSYKGSGNYTFGMQRP